MKKECRSCKYAALCVPMGRTRFMQQSVYRCRDCRKLFFFNMGNADVEFLGGDSCEELSKLAAAVSEITYTSCVACDRKYQLQGRAP